MDDDAGIYPPLGDSRHDLIKRHRLYRQLLAGVEPQQEVGRGPMSGHRNAGLRQAFRIEARPGHNQRAAPASKGSAALQDTVAPLEVSNGRKGQFGNRVGSSGGLPIERLNICQMNVKRQRPQVHEAFGKRVEDKCIVGARGISQTQTGTFHGSSLTYRPVFQI